MSDPVTVSHGSRPWRPLFLLALCLALVSTAPTGPVWGVPRPAEVGSSTAASATSLDRYADWLLYRGDGVRRNGLLRKLSWLSGPTLYGDGHCTVAAPCLQPDVEQSTAACTSLEFLARYYPARAASQGRTVNSAELAIVNEFADAVLAYRVDPTPGVADLADGAVASSLGDTQLYYTSFGNAVCGDALLAAHAVTGEVAYRTAAVGIGEFLLRMQDPRAYYLPYGAHPFVDASGQPTAPLGGYFDQVSSWNNLFSTMSLWNMTAVAFLQHLETVAPSSDGRYLASAAAARAYLETGLVLGTDWTTVRFSSPATAKNRIVAQSANSANCGDSRWHRKGSCTYEGSLPSGGTLGTDMVEYGLAALYRYELAVNGSAAAVAAVSGHYDRYATIPAIHTATTTDPLDCVDDTRAGAVAPYYPPDNLGPTPTNDVWDYDPHLSFGGFVRSSGTSLVSQEAKYYDIVGFGILAQVRAALYGDKFAHAYERVVASGADGLVAIQERDLTPMRLAGKDGEDLDGDGDVTESVCIETRGTLPIAHNGLGMLATVGYLP